MSAQDSDKGRTPQEWANCWLIRQDRGELSAEEHEALAQWLTDPVNRAAMERAQRAWALFDGASRHDALQAMRRAAVAVGRDPEPGVGPGAEAAATRVAAPKPASQGRRRSRVAATAAAAAILVVGAGLLTATYWGGVGGLLDHPGRAASDIESRSFSTAIGERLNVALDDTSSVTLNTDTQLRVEYSETARTVELLRGQAYFDVAADPHRPFVVQAGSRRVAAVGTAFEVHVSDDQLEVALAQGEVRVQSAQEPDPAAVARPLDEIVLQPGQRLVTSLQAPAPGASERISEIDVERELRWRTGFVEFVDAPLRDVVAELNRYTTRPAVIRDPDAADLRVSGIFRTGRMDDFLALITAALPVAVERPANAGPQIRLQDATGDSDPERELANEAT